jgi:hypothetical protein
VVPESLGSRAALLNRECVATSMDPAAFSARLDSESGSRGLHRVVLLRQPHLFAPVPVFLSRADLARMRALIHAVESVVATEWFEREALSTAPPITRHGFGPRGVFFGYDFHLGGEGPQLIEINTNAGGAFLSLVLAKAQRVRCEVMARLTIGGSPIAELEGALVAMFREEWRRQRGDAPLRVIAIVDERPRQQFLHPEFLLCQAMLLRAGYEARVLAVESLVERGGVLFDGETAIDLVYNRSTDFPFDHDASAALRRAYEAGGVVVTPHPRAHALHADKRLLTLLTDGAWLSRHGVPEATRERLLQGIPRTEVLDAASRARLWRGRGALFFKPRCGFGSLDVHQGDELTEALWAAMADGAYVAQRLVLPGERTVEVEGRPVALKLDVRAYAYGGEIQLVGARLYQGATTNLRTAGGGFAPVYVEGEGREPAPYACWEECPIGGARRDLEARA